MKNEKSTKTYVVHNPVSGTADAETVHEKITQALEERAIPFEIYETTGKEDIREVVKKAIRRGFQRFVAVGGDGTISAVAGGLVNTEFPLIIAPTGTVNALARELGIPLASDDAIEWWIDSNWERAIDVVEVNQHYFLLNVSIGTSASIMKNVRREDIHRLGVIPYVWESLKHLAKIPSYRFRVKIDDWTLQFRASELFIANSGMLLGWKALQLDPDASLDNGKLTVCRARINTIFDYVRMAFKIAVQSTSENEDLNCVDALREVHVETNHRAPVQGDGEQIGYTPVTVKLIPHALHVIVPPRRA